MHDARNRRAISRRGAFKLAGWTFFGTLGCLVVSLTFNYLYFRYTAPDAMRQGLVSATVLPIVLAGPLFLFLTLKLRELAIVNHKLNDLASVDALTGCLNRRAFTLGVESQPAIAEYADSVPGVLLVIDADRFKAVNDRYGHDAGDEALRLIASAIRASVRDGDLVGRLGGEEFGVYLRRSSRSNALDIAERIRVAVMRAEFRPKGAPHQLSVSIGCAVRDGTTGFAKLFRSADMSLYEAKTKGRNRVELSSTPSLAPEPENLAS